MQEPGFYTLSNFVRIPRIGFGTWQLPDSPEAVKTIRTAIQRGYRLIDSAQMYHNEVSVGEAAKTSGVPRCDIFITSKLANDAHGYHETIAACEESLSKLQMEYIDLFLIHWPYTAHHQDGKDEHNANTWRAFEQLYRDGKVLSIGVSNFMPHHIENLCKTASIPPMVNQLRLFPGITQPDTVACCKQHGILPEAYSPLGYGLALEMPTLVDLAGKYGKTVAQICLRWSIQMGFLPIPKTANAVRMDENLDVFDFELSEDDMQIITTLPPPQERG